MRDIKFKGLGVDGKWWFGENKPRGENHVNLATFFSNAHVGVINPETIGEFIGLHDKKNKEIYHKDIICRNDSLYIIEWHDNLASWYLKPISGGWHGINSGEMALMCEVIGNIWENPGLLEVKK